MNLSETHTTIKFTYVDLLMSENTYRIEKVAIRFWGKKAIQILVYGKFMPMDNIVLDTVKLCKQNKRK